MNVKFFIDLITQDQSKKAAKQLLEWSDQSGEDTLHKETAAFLARLNSIENQLLRGLVTYEQYTVSLNNINKGLIALIKEYEEIINSPGGKIPKKLLVPIRKRKKISPAIGEYQDGLRKYFQKPIFKSAIPLSQVYVEPEFTILRECWHDWAFEEVDQEGFVPSNLRESIHTYINTYFVQSIPAFDDNSVKEETNLLIILGQPGQGKTSFCYKVIHDLIDRDKLFENGIYYIKLSDISNHVHFLQSPIDEITAFLQENCAYPPSERLQNCIVIMDGLDQLAMSEGLSYESIDLFISTLDRALNGLDTLQGCKMIITSRLHYLDPINAAYSGALVLGLAPFSPAQQESWVSRFNKFIPKPKFHSEDIRKINDSQEEALRSIKELLNQPVLLFLIANLINDGFEIKESKNKAKIYDLLFSSLIKREWDKRERGKRKYPRLNQRKLRSYVSFLALQIFQSEDQYLRFSDLKGVRRNKEVHSRKSEYFGRCRKQYTSLLKEILVQFYFKTVAVSQSNNAFDNQTHTIEFYHKSLQEFLTAEKIFEVIRKEFLEKEQNGSPKNDDWQEALKIIWQLTSDKSISSSREISDYLIQIVKNYEDEKAKARMFRRMLHFFPCFLRCNFLYEFTLTETFVEPISKMVATFYPFWQILSNLGPKIELEVPDQVIFLKFLKMCQMFSSCRFTLRHLDFTKLDFAGMDFSNADFSHSTLTDTNFTGANLTSVDFREANIEKSILNGANLSKVNLSGRNFSETILVNTTFAGSNLVGANLYRALFYEANLVNANLNKANLIQANFENAIMSDADLSETKMFMTNLSGANLQNANLKKSNLKFTNLSGSDLSHADLRDLEIECCNFENAVLTFAFVGSEQQFRAIVPKEDSRWMCHGTPKYDDDGKPFYLIVDKKSEKG